MSAPADREIQPEENRLASEAETVVHLPQNGKCDAQPEFAPGDTISLDKNQRPHPPVDPYGTIAPDQGPSKPAPPSAEPQSRFKIVRAHARGGLGEVLVAWDTELQRKVALKTILPHLSGNEDKRKRFENEALITGLLEHPGVVPVYGLGHDAKGKPYYAMRFVEGDSFEHAIKQFYAPKGVATDQSLRSVEFRKLLNSLIGVCQVIAFAHSRGVIHRDLKPANIMLGQFGETLVVDWGLAKLKSAPADVNETTIAPLALDDAQLTRDGAILGTVLYMSPEQARGEISQVGPEADIYSLGATLFHLLTGKPPAKETADALAAVRTGQFARPREVRAGVPKGLEAICLKAMSLSPKDRYATADQMAADLEKWLADEPVSAMREPLVSRVRRWCRRHRAAATAAAIVTVTLAATSVLVYEFRSENKRQRSVNEATKTRLVSETKAREVEEYHAIVNRVRNRNLNRPLGWTWQGAADLIATNQLAHASHDLVELRSLAAACLSGVDFRLDSKLKHKIAAGTLAISPDGTRLAVGQQLSNFALEIEVFDFQERKRISSISFQVDLSFVVGNRRPDRVGVLAFSRDGAWLAAGTRSGWIHAWRAEGGFKEHVYWKAHTEMLRGIAWTPASDGIYTVAEEPAEKNPQIKRWAFPPTKETTAEGLAKPLAQVAAGGECSDLELSQDGNVLLVTADRLRAYNAATLEVLPAWKDSPYIASCVRINPNQRLIATNDLDILTLNRAERVRTCRDLEFGQARPSSSDQVEFSPDGSLLVSTGDRLVKVWDPVSGLLWAKLNVPGQHRLNSRFHPNGRWLIVQADDETFIYELSERTCAATAVQQECKLMQFAFDPTAKKLVCLGEQIRSSFGTLTRWNYEGDHLAKESELPRAVSEAEHGGVGLSVDASARYSAVVVFGDPTLFVDDLADQSRSKGIPIGDASHPLFRSDGKRLFVCGTSRVGVAGARPAGRIFTLSVPEFQEVGGWENTLSAMKTGMSGFTGLAQSGSTLAAGSSDGYVRLFTVDNDQLTIRRALASAGGVVRCVALSPDATLVAHGAEAGIARVDRVADGKPVAELKLHTDSILSIAFSHDGKFLATGGRDRKVGLWTLTADGVKQWLTLDRFAAPVIEVQFSPTDASLAVLVRGENAIRILRLNALRDKFSSLYIE